MVERTTGEVVDTIRPSKRGHILHELCRSNCIGTASTMVLRRKCLEKVGLFDEGLAFGEEYDMWIRVARHFDFSYLDEPLVKYSVHSSQLSTNHAAMMRGMERKLHKYGTFFAIYPEDLGRRYLSLGTNRCFLGETREGRDAFRRSIRAWPWNFKHYAYYALALLGPAVFRRAIRRDAPPSLSDEKWRERGIAK
jgi:hypothetical protein